MNEIPRPGDAGDWVGEDEIVAEVRAARDAIFARAGYDIQELGRQLRARQAAAGRAGVTLPPKPPESDSPAA
ncbi:MAG: hypothetical protein V4550_18935 [Gemmatimonadota bacterium]